jgi:HSP20 family protein
MADIVRRESQAPQAQQRGRGWDPLRQMRELLRWDPFREMAGLWPTEGMLPRQAIAFTPEFDVRETADAFVFKADLPGVREEDVDINISGNRLMVSGKREEEETAESDTFFCCERSYGTFTRSFTLPEGIDADQVRADMKDGVLTLHVPKKAEAQPKKIAVGAGKAQGKVKA